MDFSSLIICLANGENALLRELEEIRQTEIKDPAKRFTLEMTGLQAGDLLIGFLVGDKSKGERDGEEDGGQENVKGKFDQGLVQECFFDAGKLNRRRIRPLWLFERKTIADFCQSFKSGHFDNQKARMISFRARSSVGFGGCQLGLIVEGFYDASEVASQIGGIPVRTLEQAFASIIVRDGFRVVHRRGVYDHADFIYMASKTIVKYGLVGVQKNFAGVRSEAGSRSDSVVSREDYLATIKIKKKSNLDPVNCYLMMIASIPDISVKMATRIAKDYPNLSCLIQYLEQEGEMGLAELKLNGRRLGKVKSKKIHDYLLFVE